MSEAERYRRRAAECAQLAARATAPAARTALQRSAESWLLLAELLEGPYKVQSPRLRSDAHQDL